MKNKKLILAIDTSTHFLSMALYKDEQIFCSTKNSLDHSENLVKILDKILSLSEVRLKDINLLAVNIGPGSFTGLRIGLCFVRFLAKYFRLKIVTTNSFWMLLYEFIKKYDLNKNCKIVSLFPSVKNEFYFCEFEVNNKKEQKMLKYGYVKQSEMDFKNVDFFLVPKFVKIDIKNSVKLSFSAKQIIQMFLDENSLYKIVSYYQLVPFYVRHTYY
jgi:tRNA threonylcarbamoyl adenosine modification protein YeaZ